MKINFFSHLLINKLYILGVNQTYFLQFLGLSPLITQITIQNTSRALNYIRVSRLVEGISSQPQSFLYNPVNKYIKYLGGGYGY